MPQPLVTVIIPTKNAGKLFNNVLARVLSQKTDFYYEILVIDSGSSDGTAEWLKQAAAREPRVRFLEILPTEFGHGKTRNLGVQLSTSEYCAFLTHDALPINDSWLSNLLKPLLSSARVAGVFGRHRAYPHASAVIDHELKNQFDAFVSQPIVSLDDLPRYQNDVSYRQSLHFYSDNNSALRKSIWEKIPYPEINFAEDQAWAKLIIEAGFQKAYADGAVVFHSHSYGVIENFRRAFDESLALNELFFYKLCPNLVMLILQTGKKTIKDWRVLMEKPTSKRLWLKVFILNFSKFSGYYLGGSNWFPRQFGAKISLDQALKRKSRDHV